MRRSILLVGIGCLAGVLIAEGMLALVWPMQTYDRLREDSPAIFLSSDTFPYRLKPGASGRLVRPEFASSVTINSLGYRGAEFDSLKGDRFRILAIGDSYTFGWGVSDAETYPARLQRILRERPRRPDIEVINGGFAAGYYPDTYYLYLKNIGLELDPDLVLLGLFIGNDIDHSAVGENEWPNVDANGLPLSIQNRGSAVDEQGYLVRSNPGRRYRYPVLRNSHLFQLAVLARLSRPFSQVTHFNHWMYRDAFASRTEEAVRKVQELLVATVETARAEGVPILVVMIPAREQLRPEDYRFTSAPYMEGYDLEKPQRLLAEFFDEKGIRHLDLLPGFREHRSGDALYFRSDTHWTATGNEVASQIISEYLIDSGAVPAH